MILKCVELLAVAVIAYLIGSIPTGYLIVKAKTGQDIRTVGSGSTGATNVKRVLGKNYFFLVMLLDALKGALPVVLASMLVASVANVLFGAISGTGNTKSALVLELITILLYTGYIFVVGIILMSPVPICFTTEVVYYGVLLIVSYFYLTKGKWQNKEI